MDLLTTLTIFGSLLGIVALFAAAITYVFEQNVEHPNRRMNRRITISLTAGLLGSLLVVQYALSPQSSLVTFVPGVPFPGSTLTACHITARDLPQQAQTQASLPPQIGGLNGKRIDISGSSVLYGLFNAAATVFDGLNGSTITVEKLSSGQGLRDVLSGHAQIGLSDVYAQDVPDASIANTHALRDYQIGVAPFTLLVSPDLQNSVQNLTTRQIVDIFSGRVTNWREIGGPDEPVTVLNRQPGSGSRIVFEKYVLGIGVPSDDLRAQTTQTLLGLLAQTNGAIGYAATTSLIKASSTRVFPICIDGVPPTQAAINQGTYTFWSYEHAYIGVTQSSPLVRAFLQYICNPDFQANTLRAAGFLRIQDLSSDAIATHSEDYPSPAACG